MKILMVNGSPKKGETRAALEEMGKVFSELGAQYEIVDLGSAPVNDCIACRKCTELKKCVIGGDAVNELIEKAKTADGFVFGTPVYYAHPSARVLAVLDRAFYAGKYAFMFKPAAAITSLRRAGSCASMDVMNKYFTISEMPVVSSSYWNQVFRPSENESDAEGRQTMRNLARNMVWLVSCIEAGREKGIGVPASERGDRTNFNR